MATHQKPLKLVTTDEMVFVDIGCGYLIYVGTKTEIKSSSIEHLHELIYEAIVYTQYRSIETTEGLTKH